MQGRQSEKNDLAFYALMISMGVLVFALLYSRAKKFLTGRTAAVPVQAILRKQAEAKLKTKVMPIEDKPTPAPVGPERPVAVTRETRAESYSPPASPTFTKKREKRAGSLGVADKTIAVQAKLLARQQEKQLKKEKEKQQAEAASKERAAHTERFRQQRAAMKAQKLEEQAQMAEALACSPVDEAAPPLIKKAFPSIIASAKKQILTHALFLAEFKYTQPADGATASQHATSQTLAFLYHFHRYNICRRLLKDKGEDVSGAVKLRTLLVHLANKVSLTPEIIQETKAQLCSFMGGEVVRRVQQYSHISVKNDAGMQKLLALIGDGANKLNFNSIQSLPLYDKLYKLQDELQVHPHAPQNITAIDLYKWMHEKIIPYMNALCVEQPANWQDTLKMLVIILGEYCDGDRIAAMDQVFAGVSLESRAALANVRAFMDACRQLRNQLSHNIFEINEDDLLALQNFACHTISAKVADVAMMDDILVPQSVAVLVQSARFVSRLPSL